MIDQSDPGDQLLGQLLQLSLKIPTINHIYLVDGAAVLTCWGSLAEGQEAQENVLSKLSSFQKTPEITDFERSVPIKPEPIIGEETASTKIPTDAITEESRSSVTRWRSGWDWLRWLLIILAAIVLGLLLTYGLRSCDLNPHFPSIVDIQCGEKAILL